MKTPAPNLPSRRDRERETHRREILEAAERVFAVPFALSGVAIALYLTRTPMSMVAYIGAILLVGVVVNNAIVLIDYINLLRTLLNRAKPCSAPGSGISRSGRESSGRVR